MSKLPTTTASLQTPPGRGGIAVISLSGAQAGEILGKIFRPIKAHKNVGAGKLQLGHLIDGEKVIDEAVVHCTDSKSEINIHGGPVVAKIAMQLLASCGADVEPAHKSAAETFTATHPKWNNPAIGMEMLEELNLTRSGLVASALSCQWSAGLSELTCRIIAQDKPNCDSAAGLCKAVEGFAIMQKLLCPVDVVLAGPPNVGKSTLTNALTGRPVSIVHSTAGTTRDWVRELAILDGVPIYLTDTAGIWQPPEGIDAEAVRRARSRVEKADLVLLLGGDEHVELPKWCHAQKFLRISTKSDVCQPQPDADAVISAQTGQGVEDLKRVVLDALDLGKLDITSPMAFTQRQVECLETAVAALEKQLRGETIAALESLLRELPTSS